MAGFINDDKDFNRLIQRRNSFRGGLSATILLCIHPIRRATCYINGCATCGKAASLPGSDNIKTNSLQETSNVQSAAEVYGGVRGRMEGLFRQAGRRMLHNELLAQGATAGSAALAAFILLLLTGTQVLNWQWLVLIPAAALAYGIWRARKRLPSLYRVAQIVDRRLDLSDTLSTAWFFAQSRETKVSA